LSGAYENTAFIRRALLRRASEEACGSTKNKVAGDLFLSVLKELDGGRDMKGSFKYAVSKIKAGYMCVKDEEEKCL
jgi:hypothetical protein